MTTVMMSVLILLSLFLICYPIWKDRQQGLMPEAEWLNTGSTLNSRSSDKDVIMNTLSEIEFDFHMNKLSNEDYQFLKTDYAKAALAIMDSEKDNASNKTMDRLKSIPDENIEQISTSLLESIDQEIEEELQAMEISK